jgi:hypothetical protein
MPQDELKQLRHDFLNDINSLRMNLEALNMVREDPDEFVTLTEMMRDTISVLHERVEHALQRFSADSNAH